MIAPARLKNKLAYVVCVTLSKVEMLCVKFDFIQQFCKATCCEILQGLSIYLHRVHTALGFIDELS